jgi:hypothetical protein
MKKPILCTLFLAFQVLVMAQGWQRALPDSMQVADVCNDFDGGYLIAGVNAKIILGQTDGFVTVIKTDAKGTTQWTKTYTDFQAIRFGGATGTIFMTETPDHNFLIYGNSLARFLVKKIDRKGNTIWNKDFGYLQNYNFKLIKNNMVLTNIGSDSTIIVHLNLNADTISRKSFARPNSFSGYIVLKDGYWATTWSADLFKYDSDGRLKFSKQFSEHFSSIFNVLELKDSNYLVLGTLNNVGARFLKIDKIGNPIGGSTPLSNTIDQYVLAANDDLVGILAVQYPLTKNVTTTRFDLKGNIKWSKFFTFSKDVFPKKIIRCPEGYMIVGNLDADVTNTIFMVKLDENGNTFPNSIEGRVGRDFNKNCLFDNTDKPFVNCLVEATKPSGETYAALTDTNGYYNISLDTGSFSIKANPLLNKDLWQTCTPSVSKTISAGTKLDKIDFNLPSKADCPAMQVTISTPILRRCFDNTYTVKYINNGTIKLDNAYIILTIDSLLELKQVDKAYTLINARSFRVNLGTVDLGGYNFFNFIARVRCGDSTRLGQTLCVEARIFPYTACLDTAKWSGAEMSVTGTCERDSVLFTVKNVGRAKSASLNLVVIDDDIAAFRTTVQLPVNGVYTKKFPANGHTWRMNVQQEPFHPISTEATAFVEGCRANSLSLRSAGFATQFANDDKALIVDIDCQEIRGAYDPNDKIGYPKGIKATNQIPQNQDIEYKIRFQNTGTDTAFTVAIRDTISAFLDISSLELGASSHPYTIEIYGKNILKFTFNNILLVDSFKNEPKSNGFVQYRIKQKRDVAFGSKILNSAGIYFDFNDPVLTNQTLHTVSKDIISGIFDKVTQVDFPVKIAPNPFSETAVFDLPKALQGASFELLDMNGKVLKTEHFEGQQYHFYRHNLPAGIYLFKISEKEYPLSIGKLIIQ